MNIKLSCSNSFELLLQEVLEARDFTISDDAEVTLVERGNNLPDSGISIVFNSEEMDQLISFLKKIFIADSSNNKNTASLPDHLLGQSGDNYELVNYQDIILLETEAGNIYARTTMDKDYRIKEKLYELENMLTGEGFIRINKSNIVNILHINEIVPWFNGRLLLKLNNNKEVEVSRSYAGDFKEFLGL
jgi:DNA-binding LytR/AlgR family response regulator